MLSGRGNRPADLRADLREAVRVLDWSTFVRRVLPQVADQDLLSFSTGLLPAPAWPPAPEPALADATDLAQVVAHLLQ